MVEYDAADRASAAVLARGDLYFYSRWMFEQRRGYKWMRSAHHKMVSAALMRVYRGECNRLIINIPPRYSKTELAVVNFIAWSLGHTPDAEFIHASYSATLATNNSAAVLNMVQHEAYREIFPGCALSAEAKAHWKTTAGGVMYAAGAGGTITGFGAGKHRPGFGGCFPYGQLVETEIGPIAIGDLVTKKIAVRVWSWNEDAGRAELMPVDTFWTNPANDIVEVGMPNGSSFRCTPNHRLLTGSGWFEARQLADSLDLVQRKSGFCHRLISGLCRVGGKLNDVFRMLGLKSPISIWKVGCNASPSLSQLDLANDAGSCVVSGGEVCSAVGASEDGDNLIASQFRAGPSLQKREGSVSDGVLHVLGLGPPCKVFQNIVSAIAVKVSRFVGVWARAYERLKHKVCDVSRCHVAVDREIYAEVSLAIVAGLEKAQRGFSADAPHAGDFVKSIGASYIKPAFVRHVDHAEVTYCLEVRGNHNFILAQSGAIVSNCIIIDDPHKPDEARSDVMRQNVLDWFQNTLESRKNSPQTPIILIMQRLHENDLAGWLLGGGNGEQWEHVCLPAIQADGSALWPEKHSIDDLRRMEQASPYVFAGQYMQRPAPLEGGIFKPDQIKIIDAIPADKITWCRGWDLASTTDGDWTAGGRIGRMDDGRIVIGDMVRLRAGPDERDAAIANTAAADGRNVKVSLPQDPGQAGKTQVLYLTRSLAGYRVTSSPESGDKVTRAEPFAAQVNVGNVLMLRGEWNQKLKDEMRMFPNGTHDDQVDACSRAFAEVVLGYGPAKVKGLRA